MGKESNARFLGFVASELILSLKPTSGYTEKEESCKGCMGLCGRCEDGDAPEPDPEEVPDQDWAAQKTEYEL